MKINVKSKKFWIFATLGFVLLAGLVVLLIWAISSSAKFLTPQNLYVQKASNGQIVMHIDKHSRATKYVFTITPNNQTPFDVVSLTNEFDATNVFTELISYNVSCKVFGAKESNTSDSSESVTFINTQTIQTPELQLTKTASGLHDTYVLRAHTNNKFPLETKLKFTLIFVNGFEIETAEIITADNTPSTSTTEPHDQKVNEYSSYVEFQLNDIFAERNMPYKSYSLSVKVECVATASNIYSANILPSATSQPVTFNYQ